MTERPILFTGPMIRVILDGKKTQMRRIFKGPLPPGDKYHLLWLEDTTIKEEKHNIDKYHWASLNDYCGEYFKCPFGIPGDNLWARETFGGYGYWEYLEKTRRDKRGRDTRCYRWHYAEYTSKQEYDFITKIKHKDNLYAVKYDFAPIPPVVKIGCPDPYWRSIPSVHMPRWASRINLEVLNVRVERVQDMAPSDIRAEGIDIRVPGENIHSGMNVRADIYDIWIELWDSIYAKRGFGWDINPFVWWVEFKAMEANREMS